MFQLLPVQVRDPEAQPHLPAGTLAKNLAHLALWVHQFFILSCDTFVLSTSCFFAFFTVNLDVCSEGKTSEEGSLDNTYTCQEKISCELLRTNLRVVSVMIG